MCGIVGMAGMLTNKEETAMKTLLILDSLRGTDSTGIAVIDRNGETKLAKQVGNPFELFEHASYNRSLLGINRAIIGHNRFGTQGAVNRRNAHPFDFDTLVGVHNGTLKNKWKLEDANQFTVDSENLYHHIEKKGLRDALDIIDGAWALVWWDKNEETINFLRNKERPLYAARSVDGKVMFWASERWMLSVACSRESLPIGDILEIAEDMHHSVHVDGNGVLSKMVVTPMAGRAIPIVTHNGPYYPGAYRPNVQVKEPPALPSPFPKKDDSKNNRVVPITTRHRQILTLKAGYENSKNASLEVVGLGSDSLKATYYICQDADNIEADIRLYYTKRKNGTPACNIGTRMTADIGALKISPSEGSYYKVIASSVTVIKDGKGKIETYIDADGNRVDFNTWMNKHSTCDYCQGNVFPTEGYKFTKNKEVLCGFCASDEAISSLAY